MGESFVNWDLDDILIGEPLPGNIYLYINFRFLTYKPAGDVFDRNSYDRFQFRKVKTLFILEQDRKKFTDWAQKQKGDLPPPPANAQAKEIAVAREDLHRKTMDIFLAPHPDKMVEATMNSSKKLVTEMMKQPYAVQSLAQLQTYSRGTVDHSINVSVLATYLAMQMGYTHAVILQHVGMGALMHDIGKPKVPIADEDDPSTIEEKMKAHTELGVKLLESMSAVPNEVKMIVAQHHECHDGTGYPKKLRGNGIYDLSRIVAIANTFDGLVADGKGTLVERQRAAVRQLDELLYKKFDPVKLEKSLKILKLGI